METLEEMDGLCERLMSKKGLNIEMTAETGWRRKHVANVSASGIRVGGY